jgi:hypothetical protein
MSRTVDTAFWNETARLLCTTITMWSDGRTCPGYWAQQDGERCQSMAVRIYDKQFELKWRT